MENEERVISSIDKVLGYIQDNIDVDEDIEKVGDMIDVHTLLTSIKATHLKKTKKFKMSSEDLYTLSYMTTNSFKTIFGGWESTTKVIDDRILIFNDIIYIDINRDEGYVQCDVSFYHNTAPVIVAEIINTLKDIFSMNVSVNNECFIIDDVTGEYIWGQKNIEQHLKNIHGNRVKPMLFFDDETVGNS